MKKIRANINNNLAAQNKGIRGNNFCKIGTNGLYEEDPCPNNVEINNEFVYDEIYTTDPVFNNITVNRPRNIGTLNLLPQRQYVLSANIIRFTDGTRRLVKFGLTRMKVFFSLYKLNWINKLECCNYIKGKGEIIDVGINHPESQQDININDYARININRYNFNIPTLNYLLHEHLIMLINSTLPWELPKWEKRIKRFFSFATLKILVNFNSGQITNLRDFCNDCLVLLTSHNNNPIYVNNPIFLGTPNLLNNPIFFNNPNIVGIVPNSVQDNILSLIKNINKINVNNYNVNITKFDDFIRKLTDNINSMVEIFNDSYNHTQNPTIITNTNNNLTNRINMFGGFDMCNMSNPRHILKNIINKLQSYIGTRINLNMTINDRFYLCYTKLIEFTLNHTHMDQIFINNLGVEIYNSNNDISGDMMDQYGNRKILRNYNLNINGFMFLNFLLEYQCFLITYENLRFHTTKSVGTNQYRLLNWTNPRSLDKYKHEIIDKNPEELLKIYCGDINDKFYRFINLLLLNLKNKLNFYLPINIQPPNPYIQNLTLDEIKTQLFELNHKDIDIYNPHSYYNYMYHSWKNRLARYISNKYTGLNNGNLPRRGAPNQIPVGININNLQNYFIVLINNTIEKTINNIRTQGGVNINNETYIADGEGMFSNLFLIDRHIADGQNSKTYFGSCIPNTINEIYLLLRIYEDGTNVGVRTEFELPDPHVQVPVPTGRHRLWTLTQQQLNRGLTHWCGLWKRLTFNNGAFINSDYYFRSVFNNDYEENNWFVELINPNNINDPANTATITASKKRFLDIFLYPIIDYRIEFIRQNPFYEPGVAKINTLRNMVATNIRNSIMNATI